MSEEKLMLKWSDFHDNVEKAFKESRECKDFFDITLVSDDYAVQAHRLVLSSGSDFFQNVLRIYSHPHPLMYLKGILKSDLEAVLEFIYTGQVSIDKISLETFIQTAKDLKVKGIVDTDEHSPKNTEDNIPKIKDELSESTENTTKWEMPEGKQYSCTECHYFTNSTTQLKRHTIQHHSKTNKCESEIDFDSLLRKGTAYKDIYESNIMKENFIKLGHQQSKCLICLEIVLVETFFEHELHLKMCHGDSFDKYSSIFQTEKQPFKITMAVCKLCGKTKKNTDHSTTAMIKHLKTWHLEQYNNMSAEDGTYKDGIVKRPKGSKVWHYFEKVDNKTDIASNPIPQATKKPHTKPNQSLVWQFFEKDAPDSAKCKVCNRTVPTPGGTTSGLWRHMKSTHGQN